MHRHLFATLTLFSLVLTPLLFGNNYDQEAELRIQNFEYEDDFQVELFADQDQVINPSAICFDDQGRMYVGEIHRWRAGVEDIRHHIPMLIDDLSIKTSADRLAMYKKHAETGYIPFEHWTEFSDAIRIVEDTNGDGRADASHIWAEDFDDPLDGPGIGLIYGDGKLYYTNIPHLWMLQDTDGDGKADERESIQEGFGVRMSISGHDMHGLVWGPDGRLYWSIGDRGYTLNTKEGKTFSEPTEGAVFRCEPDGSNLEVYYYGLRNPQELAFDKYGNLFTCDNDADAKDTGRLVYILEGGDSGWDAGHQALLNFHRPLELRTPIYPESRWALNMWLDERIWETRNPEQPAWTLPPIELVSWGPSGFCYNYGATAFPERYADYFFVCNFGGAKGDLEAFTVKPDGAGFVIGEHTKEWMVGLGNTDADFGPDGRLYISSFNNNGWVKQDIGNVYTMFDPKRLTLPVVQQTRELLTGTLGSKSDDQLADLLGHEDMRVRQQAQFKLAKDQVAAIPHFAAALTQTDNALKRLHGIWGLGQVARAVPNKGAEGYLLEGLADSDAEVRAQAAKTLGDLRYAKAAPELARLVAEDPSARVRCFAAIGVGRCDYQKGIEALVKAASENGDEDLFLRHGIVMGLTYLANERAIVELSQHESAAVRMTSLLAMRRIKHPTLEGFLDDESPVLAAEAIRAIHDVNITEALPAVAAELNEPRFGSETPAQWMLHTRLINANWRLGDEASARRLLEYAATDTLPGPLRNDALQAVADWVQPGVVDPVLANVRPLDPESRDDIAPAVAELLPALLKTPEPKLQVTAMRLAKQYQVDVSSDTLFAKLANPDTSEDVRINALEELWYRKEAKLQELLPGLIQDENPEIRSLALRASISQDAQKGIATAQKFLKSPKGRDKQIAIEALAESEHPEALAILQKSMEQAAAGKFPQAALLELLTAAKSLETLQPQLTAYQVSLDAANPLATYQECLKGGNIERGAEVFATHAAGQCNKCHKVGSTGGVAGPDLSDLGKKQDAEYILSSIVDPSSYIVPGYGLTIAFLKDGSSVGGSLMEETNDSVLLKVSAEGETRRIEKSEIQSMNPPISAMPPMGMLLTREELRDLVAYLGSLDGKKSEGH